MMMPEKKNCVRALPLVLFLLGGCSSQQKPQQFAQNTHPPAAQNAQMIEICKQEAAYRYNTREQRITLMDIEQYQGSVEIKGATARHEEFTCSFDQEGQFLHLSTS